MKKATMKENADRFVHAIFCDDIRQEVGNKASFMGCYQGELFVPFVPMMLPKLCVQVTISTPIGRPIKSLTVRLNQGENQLAAIEVPDDSIGRDLPPAPKDSTRLTVSLGMILSPFTFTEPGELRVVVITEEGEMLGPRLRLNVLPQTDVAETIANPVVASLPARKAAAKKASSRSTPAKKSK